MTRALVVLNPVTGDGSSQIERLLEERFAAAGWTWEVYKTTGDENVGDVVRAALEGTNHETGIDLVIAAGGDGTISGVAGGLTRSGVPMGVLPLGTANTFARELGIPVSDEDALELLTGEHAVVEIDALAVEDQVFVLNVSVGLSGLMMRDTERTDKRRWGRVAYVWTGFKKLFGYQPYSFHLVVDGKERDVSASEIAIVNSGALGTPSLRWSPQVELNDGQIDVVVFRARSLLDYLTLAAAVVLRRQTEEPAIDHYIVEDRVVVDTSQDLPVQADGELIGEPPVEVKVASRAVRVVVPEETGDRRSDPSATLSSGT